MNASPNEINEWKASEKVRICYENLHKPISNENVDVMYILRIVERVFVSSKNATETLVAYTMSVCDVFLNPENANIQITKKTVKDKFKEFLVTFVILYK